MACSPGGPLHLLLSFLPTTTFKHKDRPSTSLSQVSPMTLFLPLEAQSPLPSSPPFLAPVSDSSFQLQRVIKSLLKAKRIAVVCGAGISVKAGIPDFRSSDGLFQNLKKDNPTLSSGKDLFDASVFNSEATTSLFCQMIARLSELSDSADPTFFHTLLRTLDDRGKLLRIYTQNIDALEAKSGLTFGVPELDDKRYKPRSKGKTEVVPDANTAQPSASQSSTSSRLPSPPLETPRCIPLHGTLQSMHCQICLHSFPLLNHIDSLRSGIPPLCPDCTSLETFRQESGKRPRGVGRLRPSVVLYNEMHKDGEEVGEVVRKDLVGGSKGKGRAGADFLLVVGTSLRVPGTKRIVREFAKAVHSRSVPPVSTSSSTSQSEVPTSRATESSSGLVTPTPSPRRSPAVDEDTPLRTVYLNLDFPVPTREWENVFDAWIQGDAQSFAQMVKEEMEKQEKAKEDAAERKRKREEKKEEAALAAATAESGSVPQNVSVDVPKKNVKKRKAETVPGKPIKVPKRTHVDHGERLIIRLPPRPRPQYIQLPETHYSHYTPPSSQGERWVPEVTIPITKPPHASTPLQSPPSSPLSPLSTPPLPKYASQPRNQIRMPKTVLGLHPAARVTPQDTQNEFIDGNELSDLSDESESDSSIDIMGDDRCSRTV